MNKFGKVLLALLIVSVVLNIVFVVTIHNLKTKTIQNPYQRSLKTSQGDYEHKAESNEEK